MTKRFWNSTDGNYSLIFAIALVPIMSGLAGTVDYVNTAKGASKLQESLDATALAIGTKYYSGMPVAEVKQFGSDFFAANIRKGGISYNDDDGTGTSATDKVVDFDATATPDSNKNINIITSAKLTHAGFIVGSSSIWQAKRKSYVRFKPGQPACLLALDPHAATAVKVWGSTQVKLNGCVISANSDAGDAVARGGSAILEAKCVSAVGTTSGLTTSTKLDCGKPLEKQYPSLDPLYGVKPPDISGCSSLPNGKTKNLLPGRWCNKTWSGNITLAPGKYVLSGGSIQLGGNGSLTGSGVTIFLLDGANMTINANETINLSPPTSGDYAGITIYQEKANANQIKINGTLNSKITGFIYAPGAPIFYAGNSAMTGSGDCIRVVGNTVEMTGNSNLSASCAAQLGNRDMYAGRTILLVK